MAPNSYLTSRIRLIPKMVDIRFPTRHQPAPSRPDKGNASQEIDCENKQLDRARLLAGLLRECTRSLRRLLVGANSQFFRCRNKNVTGNIDCLSLTWKRKNSLGEETER
jgi:hypothetical protein